jgi:hypothetical protein
MNRPGTTFFTITWEIQRTNVESAIDQCAVLDLVQINADLAPFGELAKMCLTANKKPDDVDLVFAWPSE